MAPGVDLGSVARRTPGFTGADLANVLNEAALLTARTNKTQVDNIALDEAIDRVIAGPQRRTRLMSPQEVLITAYHEGGHAMVAAAMPATDPVQKVTILPRGKALGYTMVLPDQDKYSQTRGELLDQLAYMLGGRAAEELVFHDPTTGASNDIEKATKVARAMVTQYGMTERLGAVQLGSEDREPFVGMEMTQQRAYSESTAAIIDEEVSLLIATAHQEAFDVLVENRHVLDELVRQLLEKETLDKEQVAAIFVPLRRHEKRPAWTGSETRLPSDLPPVNPPVRPEPELEPVPAGGAQLPPATRLPASRGTTPRRPVGGRRPPGPRAAPTTDRSSRTDMDGDGRGLLRPVGQGTFDIPRIEAAVREILIAIGEDPDRDGLVDTPRRVARAYREVFAGLHTDPADVLNTTFDISHDELVLVREIDVNSTCEHHLVPFMGVAHVGYIPRAGHGVVGLSKLARVVDGFARRPQVQERLTSQIADALVERLDPRGVIVVLECEHLCMTIRGAQKPNARTITTATRGVLREPAARAEAMSLIQGQR